MIGSILDKYEILQKIGEGGMATVYRGRHTTLGRDVAIKVLHPHLSQSQRNRQRFAREARAIEHLDHDNILKIFDYSGSVQDDCYIVTEFVDGITLQALLAERGRIPSEVATIIALELAEALSYAHGLGIIHRDLKPENVMLRRDGVIKLMDFGIARFLDEMNLTVTGALVGSPAYMSPEQAMERVLDPRSDLFSLGTLLFHLVTGQLPFSGNNPSIILRNIIEGNRLDVMELAPDLSGRFGELIDSLMQVSAADRPQDAEAVHQELLEILAEVELDPSDPAWGLQSWLMDPKGYDQRLKARLSTVLLEEGRARLDAANPLGALRLFNRLLSIDEDNTEVLALIQGMHAPPAAGPRRTGWWVAAVLMVLATGAMTWMLWPTAVPEPQAPVSVPPPEQPPPAEPPAKPTPAPSAQEATPPTPPQAQPTTEPETPPAKPRPTTKPRPMAVPPVVQAVTSEPEAAPPPPGKVSVVVPDSWANIYVDGEFKGRTGEVGAIPVTPGKHELRAVNTYSLPHTETFEVASGEPLIITVDRLIPKPVIARFDTSLPPDCQVRLDGLVRGTIASLTSGLAIRAPYSEHTLELLCGDEVRPLSIGTDLTAGTVVQVGGP